MKKTKNGFPSSYWEDKDRCPSCGNFCNLDTDIDELDCCNDCREPDSKNVEVTTKQPTAVDWLIEQLYSYPIDDIVLEKINQAKAMEKEQIENAFYYGQFDLGMEADEYYNEIFKSE